ncbi:mechanosensitive ion channel family protein [Aliikangiella sp. G2MR2-5]|uniref:mechanosensitive ion channel family protein n=1 Tax=Aliikangiella sp. G2MR2-5 TaxID=2788943 RepID=UPI0018AA4793|nr:mechanosensitive ion channel domain-containing protein [Aliikangiella sp. G2MR2-5]
MEYFVQAYNIFSNWLSNNFWRWIVDGFTVGEIKIEPLSILAAVIVLVVLIRVTKWIKHKLDTRWLSRKRLTQSERDTITSIFGYISITLALLISLSVAGINIASLAIIAGALSFGIGFGLQNIVSNFISGIILLFERPIKRGDWIRVGGTEGVVKSINIRSTRLQTFDRSDVLVPNSDLLTNQVTNLMLSDSIGRIKISIGVAYGSDVEKVRDILVEIARAHPSALLGQKDISDPQALFLCFGDSALQFELRFFINNISDVFKVTSEVNFEIDKKFRELEIQIPFPQRDIHIIDKKSP